jgi:hypothetical protein
MRRNPHVSFQSDGPYHVRNDNRKRTPPLVLLKAESGPDEGGAPCLTVMLPDED